MPYMAGYILSHDSGEKVARVGGCTRHAAHMAYILIPTISLHTDAVILSLTLAQRRGEGAIASPPQGAGPNPQMNM